MYKTTGNLPQQRHAVGDKNQGLMKTFHDLKSTLQYINSLAAQRSDCALQKHISKLRRVVCAKKAQCSRRKNLGC
jgi:hypothetical protein